MLCRTFVLLSLLLVAFNIGASPVEQPGDVVIVHNFREVAPAGFKSKGPAPADTETNLQIALVLDDIPGLMEAIYDVSTPTSLNYRNFLSIE